jgi:hypothetical protein
MQAIAEIRKLADRLAQRGSSGARLTPESARLALIALRVNADLLDQPSLDLKDHPWRIEELDSEGQPLEILALVKNAVIARAAYDRAVTNGLDASCSCDRLRGLLGWSLVDLGYRARVSDSTIINFERARRIVGPIKYKPFSAPMKPPAACSTRTGGLG